MHCIEIVSVGKQVCACMCTFLAYNAHVDRHKNSRGVIFVGKFSIYV